MADPGNIGKYRILERIGRGGMGMIFKAHDPILNRPVALKVISTDIDVTDEIRTRFFREAQACARLNHPNIVTVYDMGEDGGRMFIVMELLDGVELRRLIADQTPVSLEEKLSIMAQVCRGLHYAHERGIIHRDIKPGNIMRLRQGQVKILDFGIAQIENVHEALTRTGLIMGTLRYMAPEQVRGRADHRSDIFSVGAVFYEFLVSRPPFDAKDALHLLDQLRIEDPMPLHLADPTIPEELSDIVARAMRKDPAERIADLEEMRIQIEQVQLMLSHEAQGVKVRIRAQRDQLARLQVALAARVGPQNEEAPTATTEGRTLADLQALEVDLAARIGAAEGILTQADALVPAFERGSELLKSERFDDAVAVFEGIVGDMPEHARAGDSLARARAEADARRRQLATKLVQDARAALGASEFSVCLEILSQAAQMPPPVEVAPEIASLRATAEAAVAARVVLQRAEAARSQTAQARRTAQNQADVQYAPTLWYEAEAKLAGAEAAFARAAYAEAGPAFDAASTAYLRFEGTAREARRRAHEAVERARGQVAEIRQRAQVENAPEYAREQWEAAEATLAAAQTAFDTDAVGHAADIFNETLAAYGKAEEIAREARHGERQGTDDDAVRAAGARRVQAGGPPQEEREQRDTPMPDGLMAGSMGTTSTRDLAPVHLAGADVEKVESRRFRVVADAVPPPARSRQSLVRFGSIFVVLGGLAAIAIVVYSRSPHVPASPAAKPSVAASAPQPAIPVPPSGTVSSPNREERPQPPGDADRTRSDRPLPDRAADTKAPKGESQTGGTLPNRATALPPQRGEDRLGESSAAQGRRAAEQAQTQMAGARRMAEQAAAAFFAPKLLARAQAKEREGTEAFHRSDYSAAVRLLADARSDYQAAAQEARRENDAQRKIAPLKDSVASARSLALDRRGQALAAGAERLAMDVLRAAEIKHEEADRLAGQQNLTAAERAYNEAAEQYSEAVRRAQAPPSSK